MNVNLGLSRLFFIAGDTMKTAQDIINKRREEWNKHHDIEKDKVFTGAVANHMMKPEGERLRLQVRDNPELLIEMLFVVVDKDQNTIPFFLNDVQREFISDLNQAKADYKAGKRLHFKFLVLKGRQQGFTSVITAYQLACSITQKNFAGFTLADDSDNTETIFEDKAKFPYNQLPEAIKPTEKYNNRREFHFEKLNSRWRVATAGSKGVGRSKTLNFFHGSEAAFWSDLQQMLAGLGQALTKDSIQILESTANGYNEFKDLWDDTNNWEQKFYEWWKTPEYVQRFENKQKEDWFKKKTSKAPKKSAADSQGWIFTRCKWLIEFVGLTWEQVYWYYTKWLDIKELIKQEYPCSADEAFLASGRCVFDKEIVIARKEELRRMYAEKEPLRGSFLFEWNDPDTKDKIKDETIRFAPNREGFITIYEDRKDNYPYVIGGDTKGEGKDFYAGTVINNATGNRCAVIRMEATNSKPYTHQMYCMGRYFNDALIGIEMNWNTGPIEELERLNYPLQYTRQQYDSIEKQYQKKLGWRTDGNTRPLIIDKEIALIEEHPELFNDLTMLDECLIFVYDKNNRPDAEEGKHDDVLFSDMIANEIRPQQSMSVAQEQPEKKEKLIDKLGVNKNRDMSIKTW